ncbi:NAD(P)-dependent alcohol dehydrogenase [Nocardia fluminea]|uniref:Aryl-alcohol dehydrogenase n=1 Tax=Nocardia fluminea TaxID=134984 RepID=A0A2N3VK36_9NOCA|nr:NAD(P)-dependent alcohol dehydrogenase [Nocardia fluminea]PKV81977.1 aryl-alcohol dehydrogenase [Nocardia fluminea]
MTRLPATAAVLRDARGQYSLEELQLDPPGPGEVAVRIRGAGFCHTDLLPRSPLVPTPVVTGHEGAGVVEAVGAGVNLAVGDHVVLSMDSCGTCPNCIAARPTYCGGFWPRNMTGKRADGTTNAVDADGSPVSARWFGQSSFATRTVVSARSAIKVDPSLPIELMGPLGCSVLTGAGTVLNALDVQPGSTVVIFGAGAVGLSAVMAAQVAGATTIVAVDRNPQRLELATKLGATETTDDAAQLRKPNAHYSIDTTGAAAVLSSALRVLRPGGVLGMVGTPREDWTLSMLDMTIGRTIKAVQMGDCAPQVFVPVLISLWQQGRLPFDELITTFPLHEIDAAEQAMRSGEVVKPVLLPEESA